MRKLMLTWGPAVIWAGVIFALSSLDHPKIPGQPTLNFAVHKSVHLFLYSILFLTICRGFGFKRVLLSLALSAAYGVTDELHQSLLDTHNDFWVDSVGVDPTGGLVGVALWKLFPNQLNKLKA